jgi:hypothetical protein
MQHRHYGWRTNAYKLAPSLLNYQGGTKYVHIAHMGHYWATSKLGRCHIHPPKRTRHPHWSNSDPCVKCRRHMSCCVSHLDPHAPCVICPHTDLYQKNVLSLHTTARLLPVPYAMLCVPFGSTCAMRHMPVH